MQSCEVSAVTTLEMEKLKLREVEGGGQRSHSQQVQKPGIKPKSVRPRSHTVSM